MSARQPGKGKKVTISAQDGAVVFARTAVELRPAPIEKSWILAGTPNARNAVIATSKDGQTSTIVWECSAGEFNWFYDFDEAIHILEGEVVIRAADGPARRLGPGDVVFFPIGSSAHWRIDGYVRKIAFCRKALPRPITWLIRLRSALAGLLRGGRAAPGRDVLGGAPAG
jgi:uncharacterized cupin superfamily protein